MHGVNERVCHQVLSWLQGDDSVWLITVLETWGASPRPPGSCFAYNPVLGKSVGSLSSGCIEADLIDSLGSIDAGETQQALSIQSYGQSPEERARYQLPCGGTMRLLIEPLVSNESSIAHFKLISQALEERGCIARHIDLESGRKSCMPAERADLGVSLSAHEIVNAMGPPVRLLILGWGELSRYLLPIVQSLDFDVWVCDPRQDFLAREEIPQDIVLKQNVLPDDLVNEHFNDPYCAIVALSHDPRVDDLGLIAALQGQAFYVGALGSVRTAASRRERLLELGLSDEQLNRLHAPIGLQIKSKTPPEIAISIAAELIQAQKNSQI